MDNRLLETMRWPAREVADKDGRTRLFDDGAGNYMLTHYTRNGWRDGYVDFWWDTGRAPEPAPMGTVQIWTGFLTYMTWRFTGTTPGGHFLIRHETETDSTHSGFFTLPEEAAVELFMALAERVITDRGGYE